MNPKIVDFDTWFRQVDSAFQRKTEFSVKDLPDFKWKDLFESGCSAATAIFEFADEVPEAGRLIYPR